MENKERFKYEWDLFKQGMIYLGKLLLSLVALIVLIFGGFILIRYVAIKFEIDVLSSQISIAISMAVAGVVYMFIFPWLRKTVLRFFTEKEVEE